LLIAIQCTKSVLLGYHNNKHTIPQPIQNTCITADSLHSVLKYSWDLNLTSAMLIYEDGKYPYIMRHPDFTEFIFGQQPVQLLVGKDTSNLYNYEITMKRLQKAIKKWSH